MLTTRQHIDNINYYSDRRVCDEIKPPCMHDEDGCEIELPWKYEVCPVCDGKGTHVNPAIDAGGLTREDWDDDPDFMDNYRSGMYDQQCNACKGRRVVPVVDEDRMTDEQRKAYRQEQEDEAAYEAERRAELMMGC